MDNKKLIATLISVIFVFWVFGVWASYTNTSSRNAGQFEVQDLLSASNVLLGEADEATQDALEPISIAGNTALQKDYITDMSGRTLYMKKRQTCTGKCLQLWPPYIARGEMSQKGKLGTVYNEELKLFQYTWDGEPLYYYAEDRNPGDITGHGVGGVWTIVEE